MLCYILLSDSYKPETIFKTASKFLQSRVKTIEFLSNAEQTI